MQKKIEMKEEMRGEDEREIKKNQNTKHKLINIYTANIIKKYKENPTQKTDL